MHVSDPYNIRAVTGLNHCLQSGVNASEVGETEFELEQDPNGTFQSEG